ncbi:hypothetical protein [Actinomyces faecalis]|uniref:HD domain-containing protein n=1 Tax=Actinomyces faecalis TaxID=2722820 RepID=UPI0015560F4B|nr:hypothetical protein [Actinomyces faecalis]
MGVLDAPQWLLPAYVRSVKAVGATAGAEQIQEVGERLVGMWLSPDRRFHNLKHAIDMLARVDELADESHNPDVMRLAVWYHGCVFSSATEETYRRNGGEDEVASAAYAAEDLHALGVPDKVTDRICALILNLKRHNLAREDIDALALNDADLGALAVGPQQYKRYRELVREEYAHIPAKHYLSARLTIVSKLLSRETLFSSPLGARWELAARQNLEAEKQLLEDGLAKLAAKEEQGEATCTAADAALAHLAARVEQAATEGEQVAAAWAAQDDEATSVPAGPAEPLPSAPLVAMASSVPAPPSEPVTPTRPVTAPRGAPVVPSPATPAVGIPRAAGAAAPAVASTPAVPGHEGLSHTTSMESCVADIDRLMSTPRTAPAAGDAASLTPAGGVPVVDRQSMAEAARVRLAEKLRAKVEEAKTLREARTGELHPVTEETADGGASQLG